MALEDRYDVPRALEAAKKAFMSSHESGPRGGGGGGGGGSGGGDAYANISGAVTMSAGSAGVDVLSNVASVRSVRAQSTSYGGSKTRR